MLYPLSYEGYHGEDKLIAAYGYVADDFRGGTMAKEKSTNKTVSASVDDALYQALAARAEEEERTQGVIIRRALRAYLTPGQGAPRGIGSVFVEPLAQDSMD